MSPLIKGVSLSLLLLGCSGDNFDYCSNPLGTTPQQGGNDDIVCFRSCGDDCYTECLKFKFDDSSQSLRAVVIKSIIPGIVNRAETGDCPTDGKCVTIRDIGAVECIGAFVNEPRPSSGYDYLVPLVVGHGYVVKLSDGTFGSIYVNSVTDSDGDLKANILWQYSEQ